MYDKVISGSTVKFSSVITNLNNKVEDPVGILFKIKTPAGVLTTYTYGTDLQLLKNSTGKYSIDIVLNASGIWKIRWETTAPNVTIQEDTITVEASTF